MPLRKSKNIQWNKWSLETPMHGRRMQCAHNPWTLGKLSSSFWKEKLSCLPMRLSDTRHRTPDSMSKIGTISEHLPQHIEFDFNIIKDWLSSTNMVLNIEKSGVLSNHNVSPSTSFSYGLKSLKSSKILRILFTKSLNFDDHCRSKINVMNKWTGSITKYAIHPYDVS